jgi:hypothetical protein
LLAGLSPAPDLAIADDRQGLKVEGIENLRKVRIDLILKRER